MDYDKTVKIMLFKRLNTANLPLADFSKAELSKLTAEDLAWFEKAGIENGYLAPVKVETAA